MFSACLPIAFIYNIAVFFKNISHDGLFIFRVGTIKTKFLFKNTATGLIFIRTFLDYSSQLHQKPKQQQQLYAVFFWADRFVMPG